MSEFIVKDSGARQEFASGMVRDTSQGKVRYNRILAGPMFKRWAVHLEKGAVKYKDSPDGTANWQKAAGQEEARRFKESAFSHFVAWLEGETDEDHAAGVFFNINGHEYVQDKLARSLKNWQNIKDNAHNEGILSGLTSQSGSPYTGPNSSGSRF